MSGILAPIQSILAQLALVQVQDQDYRSINLPVRIWNDQLSDEKKGKLYAYPKPWAFMEIVSQVQYEQMGVGFKSADLGIKIHLIHEFSDAQDGTMEQDLLVFGIRDKIVANLSQFAPTACNQIKMVGESMDNSHSNIYHYVLDFVTNFVDSTGSTWDANSGTYVDRTLVDVVDNASIVAPVPDYAGTPPESNTVFNPTHNPYKGHIPQ